MIALPPPKQDVLARRDEIVSALRALAGVGAVIAEPVRLKAYESDGLTACAQTPMAVVLPSTVAEVAAVMRLCHRLGVPGRAAGRGDVLGRRRAAARGRGGARGVADGPDPRDRSGRSLGAGRGGGDEPRHHEGGGGRRILLRAGSVLAAGLHDRGQRGDELGRGALPEVRGDLEQPAGPQGGDGGGRDPPQEGRPMATRRAAR